MVSSFENSKVAFIYIIFLILIRFRKYNDFIYSVSDDLFVRLTDVNGLDVGQQLCEDKLAVSGNFVPAHNDEYIFPAI